MEQKEQKKLTVTFSIYISSGFSIVGVGSFTMVTTGGGS